MTEDPKPARRIATDRPFAVNLIPAATAPHLLDAQITCCFDLGVNAFSFFWDVVLSAVKRAKQAVALFEYSAPRSPRPTHFSRRFSASGFTPGFGVGPPESFSHLQLEQVLTSTVETPIAPDTRAP